MRTLLILAGWGQIALALASLAIPRVLRWREDTAKLRTLTRQVFWTYAAYIWAAHVCFGTLSALAPDQLLDHSPLARAVSGFIAAWWSARVLIQVLWFDRSAAPPGALTKLAEAALVLLFLFLAGVYGWIAVAG